MKSRQAKDIEECLLTEAVGFDSFFAMTFMLTV